METRTPSTIDVDIGTLGRPVKSKNHLVTFDPFDRHLVREKYERLPFAVSPFDAEGGNATFYINRDEPACSSMLGINPAFRRNATLVHERASTCQPSRVFSTGKLFGYVVRCRDPRHLEVSSVPTIRLSTFLTQRKVRHINWIKVDAQGADLAIVEDLLTRTSVTLGHMTAECQDLQKAPPLYLDNSLPLNDCAALVALARRHRPHGFDRVEYSWSNSCAAEHNVQLWWNVSAPLDMG
tara:strand:+ start:2127 stop:2840 length:714 start_codon:yes stop_codon:yes gene_type:complete